MAKSGGGLGPFLALVLLILAGGWGGAGARAQEQMETGPRPGDVLRIGISEAPPFAWQDASGAWYGTNVALWNRIADVAGYDFSFVEDAGSDPVAQVARGEVDLSIAPALVDPSELDAVDFSYPYNRDGLAAAVTASRWEGLFATFRAITSLEFLVTITLLSGLAFVAGTLVWFLERRRNSRQFAAAPRDGVGDGFWWAVVTMTTVGYGDRTPSTPPGRLVAVLWMYVALILTAVVTAQLTARITLDTHPADLVASRKFAGLKVGVSERGDLHAPLVAIGADVVTFDELEAGLDELEAGRVDAVVAGRAFLTWYSRQRPDVQIVGIDVAFNDYAFVLAEDSHLRDTINLSILTFLMGEEWAAVETTYLSSGK